MPIQVDRRNPSGGGVSLPAEPGPHADLVVQIATHSPHDASLAASLEPVVEVSWRRCLNEFNLDPALDYRPTVLDQTRIKDLHAARRARADCTRRDGLAV